MPRRKSPLKTVTRTIHLDPEANAALMALQEMIGAPSLSYAIRFALVEMAHLGKLVRTGSTVLVRLPKVEGETERTVVLSINQVREAII